MDNKAKQIYFDECEMVACLESMREQLGEQLEDAPNDLAIVNTGKHINDFTTFINVIRDFCKQYHEELGYPTLTPKEYKKAMKKIEKGNSKVKKIVKEKNYHAGHIFNTFVEFHNENMKLINGACGCNCGVKLNGTIQS